MGWEGRGEGSISGVTSTARFLSCVCACVAVVVVLRIADTVKCYVR